MANAERQTHQATYRDERSAQWAAIERAVLAAEAQREIVMQIAAELRHRGRADASRTP